MKNKNGSGAGFTLIELLVVITIIGILAAIIVPSILGALAATKKAKAMAQIRDLDGAVKLFYKEYGKMPVPAGDNGGADKAYTGGGQAQVVRILIGMDPTLNPKETVFLEIDPASFGVKTVAQMQALLSGGEPFKDPWGTDYGILMDLNFDEQITGTSYGDIRAKVAVYSGGDKMNVEAPPYKTW